MSNLLNVFSTREIALFIWFLVFLIFTCRTKDTRQSVIGVIKAFFAKKLILPYSSLLLYIVLIVFLLSQIGFWDMSLLKDTCIWVLFSGIVLFINVNKAESAGYFSKVVKDNIKAVAIWEFIFNFYTLSLIGELILIPVVFLFNTMQVFAEYSSKKNEEHLKVVTLCKTILGLIGFGAICYVTYKTITEYELLFSYANLRSFLLPILLIILTLPYFYGLALYINYDSFITVVKHIHRNEDPSISRGIIRATFKYANINLKTLKRIWKYQIHFKSSKDTPDEYVKEISKKPRCVISNVAKLTMFNDIRNTIEQLSNIGIGALGEWHKSYAGDDCYLSMTNYHQFGLDDITKIPNTLAFYLTGEETYIKQLDVVLDVGFQQNKHQALEKFIEVLELLFDSLSIPMPDDLATSIVAEKKHCGKYNTHSVLLDYEKFERIEKYTLRIISE